jgi:hypothetical protein
MTEGIYEFPVRNEYTEFIKSIESLIEELSSY